MFVWLRVNEIFGSKVDRFTSSSEQTNRKPSSPNPIDPAEIGEPAAGDITVELDSDEGMNLVSQPTRSIGDTAARSCSIVANDALSRSSGPSVRAHGASAARTVGTVGAESWRSRLASGTSISA